METEPDQITMIKISSIKVSSPRSRNKFKHAEITESINNAGLRKPITVRRIQDKTFEYALICGQGRVESLIMLKEEFIPAFIIDVDEETALIMSLVENMARVNPRAGEQFNRIKEMKSNGLTDKEIAKVTGFSSHWISDLTMLIDRGESKLLAAVESGKIPISLAVEIARTDYEGAQELFIKAFDLGIIKHKDIIKVRSILDARNEGLKGHVNNVFRYKTQKKKMTTNDLTKLFQDNINEHKLLKNKALLVEENIMLTQQILQELINLHDFKNLIKEENLDDSINLILKPVI
ncbi:ParB N-terminal domain-containing protein [Phytobacter diazotrophicus]|uniref:ParB N-terminal domain-containing protein n=1 Tax=Phytobacter diazotrophicus TaxID=395631 RepID=UPI002FFACE50